MCVPYRTVYARVRFERAQFFELIFSVCVHMHWSCEFARIGFGSRVCVCMNWLRFHTNNIAGAIGTHCSLLKRVPASYVNSCGGTSYSLITYEGIIVGSSLLSHSPSTQVFFCSADGCSK